MTAEEARELFSQYLDGTLEQPDADALQALLAANEETAVELIEFERALNLLHRMPSVEPKLDLWREFQSNMDDYAAISKLSFTARLKRHWLHTMAQFSSGIIIYTHSLAANTHARFERYLLTDPLPSASQQAGE